MMKEIEEQINSLLLWRDPDAHDLLEKIATKYEIKPETMAELLAWMQTVNRKGDKYGGLQKNLDQIFENDSLWK